jgi:polysaccharide export outer membrane protein
MQTPFPKALLLIIIAIVVSSCVSSTKITYLQDIYTAKKEGQTNSSYEPKLQADDLLSIIVSAENPENALPFNLPTIQSNYNTDGTVTQSAIKTYLINSKGEIDFPVLGKIKLAGLTHNEAHDKLVVLVSDYIKNPGVNLLILNFKVSVLGEVNRPGSIPVKGERITLLEALSLAGDLTIYGKRNNILVIREQNGEKTYQSIDITNSSFINSPFYYLSQNDVIVVHPNKTKINGAAVGPNTTIIISSIALLLTLLTFLKK